MAAARVRPKWLLLVALVVMVTAAACQTASSPVATWNGGQPAVISQGIVERVIALPDGGAVVALWTKATATDPAAARLARLTPQGQLDTTFGTDGWSPAVPTGGGQTIGSLDETSDGSFVVGLAEVEGAAGFRPRAVRFTSGGDLDPSFGTGGIAELDAPSPGTDAATGATMVRPLADGTFVAVTERTHTLGLDPPTTERYVLLQDLSATGAVSGPTVAIDGLDTGTGALMVDSTGRVVLASSTPNGQALSRYSSTLVLDPTFGTAGHDPIGGQLADALAEAPDGDILVGSLNGPLLARLPDGGVDPSYGTAGSVVSPNLAAMAVDATGRLVTVDANTTSAHGPTLRRFTTAGQSDSSFGSGGAATLTASQMSAANDLAIGSTGQIDVGGVLTTVVNGAQTDAGVVVALHG
jgi:uncharacterized delta-60 repeat protein